MRYVITILLAVILGFASYHASGGVPVSADASATYEGTPQTVPFFCRPSQQRTDADVEVRGRLFPRIVHRGVTPVVVVPESAR